MSHPDEKLLNPLLDIARAAGEEIMRIYAGEFTVDMKEDKSPVTDADLAAHRVINTDLQRITPGMPVLSEESAGIPFSERGRWESYWLVDPLDGTKEFINKNGDFTVNIALIQRGVPLLGVVYVPVTGMSYYGCAGVGAFKRDKDGQASPIKVRKLIEGKPVKVVASRSHRGPLLDGYLDKLGPHETVSRGSSLKFCLVADGTADVYPRLGPTSEWDTGAGHAVVLAAGGQVIGMDGKPLPYNSKDSLLNPHFIAYADSSRDWRSYL